MFLIALNLNYIQFSDNSILFNVVSLNSFRGQSAFPIFVPISLQPPLLFIVRHTTSISGFSRVALILSTVFQTRNYCWIVCKSSFSIKESVCVWIKPLRFQLNVQVFRKVKLSHVLIWRSVFHWGGEKLDSITDLLYGSQLSVGDVMIKFLFKGWQNLWINKKIPFF